VLEWIDLAVVTATRVIHHMYPESSDWAFVPGQSDPRDDHIFRHCVWTVSDQNAPAFGTDSVQPRKRQVVLAYQCPWVLDQGDLADFASSQTVQHPLLPVSVQPRGLTKFHLLKYPAHLLPDHAFPASLSSHNKLWAKVLIPIILSRRTDASGPSSCGTPATKKALTGSFLPLMNNGSLEGFQRVRVLFRHPDCFLEHNADL